MLGLLGSKIEYSFTLKGIELIEKATINLVENTKLYCTNEFNQKLIFDVTTKECLTDNTTFGAKRTLVTVNKKKLK